MGCVTTRLGDSMNASARPERACSAKQALLSILISIALACSFAPSAFAADYDDLFDDPGFARAFYDEYGETNGGAPWTEADLEAMTHLYFSYQSIGSLDDLRLFPNITELTIAYTPMTSIEADTFQNNPSLEGIGFYGNNIATIDENAFADLPNLASVDIEGNRLTEIPANLFANNPKVRFVYLYGNSLTSLPTDLFAVPFADFMATPGYDYISVDVSDTWIQTTREEARLWFDSSGTVISPSDWTTLIENGIGSHSLSLSLSSTSEESKDKPVAMETDLAVSGGEFSPVHIGDISDYDELNADEREIALSIATMLWNYDTDKLFASTAYDLFGSMAATIGPNINLYDALGRTDVPVQYITNMDDLLAVAGWMATTDLDNSGYPLMTEQEWAGYKPLIVQSLQELSLDRVLSMNPDQLIDYLLTTVLAYNDPATPVTDEMLQATRVGLLDALNDDIENMFGQPAAASLGEAINVLLAQTLPAPYAIDFSASVDANLVKALELFAPVNGQTITADSTKQWLINALNAVAGTSFTTSTDFLTILSTLGTISGAHAQYPFMYIWNIGETTAAHTVSATPKFENVEFQGARLLSQTPGGADTALAYVSDSGTHSVTHQPQNLHHIVALDFRYTGDLAKHFDADTIANTDEDELRNMTHYVFTHMTTPEAPGPDPDPDPDPTPVPDPASPDSKSGKLANTSDSLLPGACALAAAALVAVGTIALSARRREQ